MRFKDTNIKLKTQLDNSLINSMKIENSFEVILIYLKKPTEKE